VRIVHTLTPIAAAETNCGPCWWVQEEPYSDCLVTACCPQCALTQEHRELHIRKRRGGCLPAARWLLERQTDSLARLTDGVCVACTWLGAPGRDGLTAAMSGMPARCQRRWQVLRTLHSALQASRGSIGGAVWTGNRS
jgi:hypothetical protein